MKRKQFIILVLALMLSGPSLQASTQASEGISGGNSAGNAMFDVNTSASNVAGEIKIVADEVNSLLNEAAAPAPVEEKVVKLVDHTVKAGDSLWKIAQQLLGDGNRYREIIEANKDKYPSLVKNPDLIHAGWNLKIPSDKPEAAAPSAGTTGNTGTTNSALPGTKPGTPVVTLDGGSGTAAGNVTTVPQIPVQERIKKLQNALDAANRALLAQKKRIADLNPQTIRFLIDNKFMTEEEWMSMNPPEGYVYRLDRVGKVELVGSDNKPLTNADMAKLDKKASAPATTGKPADKTTKPVVDNSAAADAKAKQEAHDRLVAEEKARKEKAAAEKAAAGKTAAEKAAAEKIAAEKAAAEKAATEKSSAELAAAAKTKYQQMIKTMGIPDLADNSKGYLNAVNKGAQLIDRGVFKSNSFDKFRFPYDYPEQDVAGLQRDLRSAQEHYEKMVDKNRTGRILGIFGDTIESAGKKVEAAKGRLQKAWNELSKSIDEAKAKAKELETEVSANKAKVDAANKELSKLDKYDAANAAQVQKLNKEIKDLNEDVSDAQKKLDGYQALKSTFKI